MVPRPAQPSWLGALSGFIQSVPTALLLLCATFTLRDTRMNKCGHFFMFMSLYVQHSSAFGNCEISLYGNVDCGSRHACVTVQGCPAHAALASCDRHMCFTHNRFLLSAVVSADAYLFAVVFIAIVALRRKVLLRRWRCACMVRHCVCFAAWSGMQTVAMHRVQPQSCMRDSK